MRRVVVMHLVILSGLLLVVPACSADHRPRRRAEATREVPEKAPADRPAPKKPEAPSAPEAPKVPATPAPRPIPATPARPEQEPLHSWEVLGTGETVEDAERDAIERIQGELLIYFDKEGVHFARLPDAEFISERLVKKREEESRIDLGGGVGFARQIRYQAELGERDRRQILEMDRSYRQHDRQVWVGKILAALVLCFAAVAGYYRLDEATKGYYSGLLRLTALGIVAAAGVGVWWYLH